MENATKALLIAAAVLVAILVISLGLVIYNQAAETVQNVKMSDTEVKAFNDQFTRYEGVRRTGTDVNALVQNVLQSNINYHEEPLKLVEITGDAVTLSKDATTAPAKVNTGSKFKVECTYNTKTKLIDKITVTNADT